jgi:hypothetical protein
MSARRGIRLAAAPIRYVADLLGADTDSERAIRWLITLIVLCCESACRAPRARFPPGNQPLSKLGIIEAVASLSRSPPTL